VWHAGATSVVCRYAGFPTAALAAVGRRRSGILGRILGLTLLGHQFSLMSPCVSSDAPRRGQVRGATTKKAVTALARARGALPDQQLMPPR
jgi:hypothetical protein